MAEDVGQPIPVSLGNFASGEVPDPLTYKFFDYLGSPIDISGGVVTFYIEKDGGTPAAGAGTPGLDGTDTDNATAKYAWNAADMVPGNFRAQFWVSKSGIVYASKVILWYVYTGIKV